MVPPLNLPPATRALLLQHKHLLQYIPSHLLYPELTAMTRQTSESSNNNVPPASSDPQTNLASSVAKRPLTTDQALAVAAASAAATTASLKPPSKRPRLPDNAKLGCRDFWKSQNQDPRVIFAMMMGVDPVMIHNDLPHFDADQPPFNNKRNRPTNAILAQELLRRARRVRGSNANKTLPRPSQWEKEKIVAALKDQYPPQLTQDDLRFLAHKCWNIYRIACRQQQQQQHQQQQEDGEWSHDVTWFRFYHAIVELRQDFSALAGTTGASAKSRRWAFWEKVSQKLIQSDWIPQSIVMKEIGLETSVPLEPTLKETTAFTAKELAHRFQDVRNKLKSLVSKHNIFKGGSSSSLSLSQSFSSTANIDEQMLPRHCLYFWELAQQAGIFKSLLESTTDMENVLLGSPSALLGHDNMMMMEPGEQHSQQQQLLQQQSLHHPIAKAIPALEDLYHKESQFLKSQNLYLEQLELYNKVENEWLGMEEKCLAAKDGNLKELYAEFAQRKQESLQVIREQLEQLSRFCEMQKQVTGLIA